MHLDTATKSMIKNTIECEFNLSSNVHMRVITCHIFTAHVHNSYAHHRNVLCMTQSVADAALDFTHNIKAEFVK